MTPNWPQKETIGFFTEDPKVTKWTKMDKKVLKMSFKTVHYDKYRNLTPQKHRKSYPKNYRKSDH